MLLRGLDNVKRVKNTKTTAHHPVISSLLFLQLAELPSLLTQLLVQPGVFAPRLRTNWLWLILKKMECW